MDYSKMGKDALKQQVPNALTLYLKKNEKRLKLGIAKVWRENGKKNTGTWEEVFGNGYESKAYCTVWQYASYINHVAEAGKAEYPLPMYCNCWLVQKEEDLPGVYPNGGPVDIVMDIWKAAAPAVDFLSPDIYLPNFKSIVADYYRYDNPLFIPEVRMNHAWAMYAFGQYGAMGFSPFGIEDRVNDKVYAGTSLVVKELAPLITKYAGSSKMVGLLNDSNASGERIEMGKYVLDVAVVVLIGQCAIFELHTAVIDTCADGRSEPFSDCETVRGFQASEEVFAAERCPRKAERTPR